jgi:hypothetical protein
MALVYASTGATHGTGLITRFASALVVGFIAYFALILLAQRSLDRRSAKGVRLE